MAKGTLISDFKKSIIGERDKKGIYVKKHTSTVNCPLDHLIVKNAFVTKMPIATELKHTVYNGESVVSTPFFSYYNRSKNICTFKTAINEIVEWTSDLKAFASTFNNYLWQKLVDDDVELPEINDVFFTNLLNAVSGKKSNYSEYFDQFAKLYQIKYYIPWMSNTSQIITYLKTEMVTVTKNNIILNFRNRCLSTIRWRILDLLSSNSSFRKVSNWKICLQQITDEIFNYVVNSTASSIKAVKAVKAIMETYEIEMSSAIVVEHFTPDRVLFGTILQDNPTSRRQLLKQKKDDFEPTNKTLLFEDALKYNPQKFVKYMYYCQQKIATLELTNKYDLLNRVSSFMRNNSSSDIEITELLLKQLWSTWKWKQIHKPGFKLMPLNEINKQFIRIDKRSFIELGIGNIYFTGQSNVDKQLELKGTFNINKPKIIVPIDGIDEEFFRLNDKGNINFATKNGYINPETKTILELVCITKFNLDNRDDKWWMDDVLNIYSKKANIRQLRRETFVRSPNMFKLYSDVADLDTDWCPWIPGASFMTDGFQTKIQLVCLRNTRTPGLDCLFSRGFTGFKKKKEAPKLNVSEMKRGIFVFGKQNLCIDKEDLKNHIFVGFDPGRKKPLAACTLDGAEIPFDWKDEKRIEVLDNSLNQNSFISNDQYRNLTGSKQQEEYENTRRRGRYREALNEFRDTTFKSAILDVTSTYYKARLKTWAAIRKEIYHHSRTCYRFKSFSKRQFALAYFAKKFLKEAQIKAKKENKKLIVLFGNGSFKPGGTGYAAVPRKPFIKELGVRCPTIITNEFRTSKISPMNFKLLENIRKGKNKSSNSDRLRQCTTDPEALDVLKNLSDNAKEIANKHRDRDAFGSVAICQKGIYTLLNNPIPYYDRNIALSA